MKDLTKSILASVAFFYNMDIKADSGQQILTDSNK